MAEKRWAMRRKDRKIEKNEALAILDKALYGVLATVGEEGEPYAVPLSFVRRGERIYFHCAKRGRKIENLLREPRVCFVAVGETKPVYQKNFTTLYESALVEGQMTFVEEEREKQEALYALCERYLPEHMEKAPGDIEASFSQTAVYRLDIESISGKAKREE